MTLFKSETARLRMPGGQEFLSAVSRYLRALNSGSRREKKNPENKKESRAGFVSCWSGVIFRPMVWILCHRLASRRTCPAGTRRASLACDCSLLTFIIVGRTSPVPRIQKKLENRCEMILRHVANSGRAVRDCFVESARSSCLDFAARARRDGRSICYSRIESR